MQKDTKQWHAVNILEESISCVKRLTSIYNSAANESSGEKLRKDFLNILMEEHQLHRDIFIVMQRRGMYSPVIAESAEIDQAQRTYSQKHM